MNKTPRYLKPQQNKLGMFLVAIVVLMVLIVVSFSSAKLKERQQYYSKKEAYLQEQIDKQNKRAIEIEEFKKYMQTKEYIEDMAKGKLGLVYPNELILEPKK